MIGISMFTSGALSGAMRLATSRPVPARIVSIVANIHDVVIGRSIAASCAGTHSWFS